MSVQWHQTLLLRYFNSYKFRYTFTLSYFWKMTFLLNVYSKLFKDIAVVSWELGN